jgi:septal ring factor EnvC (AmiA/AmiB activator)
MHNQGEPKHMFKRKLVHRVMGASAILALAVTPLVTGCVAMASKDNMRMLDEARVKAEESEAALKACKDTRAQLERDVAERKQALAKLQSDIVAVKKGLETWPPKGDM